MTCDHLWVWLKVVNSGTYDSYAVYQCEHCGDYKADG